MGVSTMNKLSETGTKADPEHNSKRLWMWLAIPPVAAMIGAAITIYYALAYPDPVINASVQKLGKVMVSDASASLEAQRLNLSAQLERNSEGQVLLRLSGNDQPKELHLLWVHPTRDDLDRGAMLLPDTSERGLYAGVLPEPPSDRGTWILHNSERSWRLENAAALSSQDASTGHFELTPVVR